LPGSEHTPLAPSKTAFLAHSGAECGALDSEKPIQDAELTRITTAWATLPEHIKAAINSLIQIQERK
jgi:hypothetical protein